MAPAATAKDPTSPESPPRLAAAAAATRPSKQIVHHVHAATTAHAPDVEHRQEQKQEQEQEQEPRCMILDGHAQLRALPAAAGSVSNHPAVRSAARKHPSHTSTTPSPTPNNNITTITTAASRHARRTSGSSAASTAIPIHDAVRPQLSERDSIFASTYADPVHSSPVTISHHTPARNEGRSAAAHARRDDRPTAATTAAAADMAVAPFRRTSVDFPPALHHHDLPISALSSIYQTNAFQQAANTSQRPNNSTLQQQFQRRSLYDLHDLTSLPLADLLQSSPQHHRQFPDTPLQRDSSPATPDAGVHAIDYAQLDQSAEREQYRSWRKGQAKYPGMSIAESQRRPSKAHFGVDKVIDAQLPQPDPPMANARSRKASHYLGLFRENDAEEKRENEKKKGSLSKDKLGEAKKSKIAKDVEVKEGSTERTDIEESIAEDIEAVEDGSAVTVSQEHMRNKLPLGLLEEIRNHHHLVPGKARTISYPKDVSGRDADSHIADHSHKSLRSEDDEWDQEHISSATYYPHQGVAPADSPNDDQLAKRNVHKEPHADESPRDDSNDVEVSLQSEGARDFLHGVSRTASVKEFEPLPEPALASSDHRSSDSEYESDTYGGYDSTVSGDDEEEAETTPTATPLMRGQEQEPTRPSARRRSTNAPAPVGAVELKPYKHQVGGHTPVYRFSRRAVCKQLNSKENMFYETVEKNHPDLLGFMPRYIGVLNVTYRKEQRKRKATVVDDAKSQAQQETRSNSGQEQDLLNPGAGSKQNGEQARIISHSMRAPQDIPQVIFENNRHLIPDNLFRVPPRSVTPDLTRARSSPPKRGNQSDDDTSSGVVHRPSLPTAASWGFTSVNEKLRDHVLREVFAPPMIHKHDRRERAHHPRSLRKLPKYMQSETGRPQRQQSVDISSLRSYQTADHSENSDNSHTKGKTRRPGASSEANSSDVEQRLRESKAGLSRSAETSEVDATLTVPPTRPHHKRRHSGGGLKRKPADLEGGRGDLEFHENEDEAYTADAEDVFSMEDVDKNASAKELPQLLHMNSAPEALAALGIDALAIGKAAQSQATPPRLGPAIEFGTVEPRNPETSLVQMDERVVRFLLLEDLTAGMQKPCVLDLKMGTRQYGVEAGEKKQASQRMKCKTTTSRELGVRVCGMQVFNVREQKYAFEDKYFGRDLKAGPDFQAALTRFFYDGIGHAQALKHIPSVLDKINQLDKIIRDLPGYRLYASSLLMIYDRGNADERGKVEPEKNEDGKPAQYPDIKLKIVDFANCVTAEDMERVKQRPCPPFNPESIDRGYLRGLRTLRAYFQKIYQDLHMERHVERGEGEGMAMDQRGISSATTHKGWSDSIIDDPGEVSV